VLCDDIGIQEKYGRREEEVRESLRKEMNICVCRKAVFELETIVGSTGLAETRRTSADISIAVISTLPGIYDFEFG